MKLTSIAEYHKMASYSGQSDISKMPKYKTAPKEDRTWTGFFRGREQTIIFDSRKEMLRFIELDLYSEYLYPDSDLFLQERFLIGTDPKTYYVADFYYYDTKKGKWVVEDAKGFRTEVFKRKKRLFQQKYPDIEFVEI